MPSRDDKPTNFREWVQQKLPGATSPEMKDALVKMVSPEAKRAFSEMARRFQQPFQEAQDPPPEPTASEPSSPEMITRGAIAPEPPPSETSTRPTPSVSPTSSPSSPAPLAPPASTPSSAPETPRRAGRGPQLDEAKRILREIYPPEGKAPGDLTYKAIWTKVVAKTPEGKKPPSEDVVAAAVKSLGRSG